MKVDIWSDIRCPFCYIGKHKFENALENFENRENVEVTWHSFQLDPNLKTQPETDTIDFFCQLKGLSRDQALQMLGGAKQMGMENGLELNLENSIVANSFKAHRLLQFAKSQGKANEVKEKLFEAHFSQAKNIDDNEALVEVAVSAGLDGEQTEEILRSDKYADEVKQDEQAARNIGVQGVPFFVFNNKYGVSGAQPEETFLEILNKVRAETPREEKKVSMQNGDSCGTEGCD